jgi:outer membrane receptor protein involved in Fe transport
MNSRVLGSWISRVVFFIVFLTGASIAQETTGGLQGTIKDASGAVVAGAHLVLTGTSLVGEKTLDADSAGYYHFANLPPGTYKLTATAKGFKKIDRDGLTIEVGHLPTLDLTMQVGTISEVVEVSGQAPVIDTTTNTNQTNLTSQILNDTPHGYSFQSVIQYAPMARNEPLAGGSSGMTGNAGGSLPGSAGNGQAVGFSIGGAADSESTYLVEGQDTENISGGASNANVPFQFIQEVQVKTSGIEAEHGGALGGVINVIMKKGSNDYHGSFSGTYEGDALDGSQMASLRYDPSGSQTLVPGEPGFDTDAQTYQPKRDHFRIVQPGFTVGGPIVKDRLWFFLGFAPQYQSLLRTVNFGPSTIPSNSVLGIQDIGRDSQTYFSTARFDFTATQKIRLFGSWLYQFARESGSSLPSADSTTGLLNSGLPAIYTYTNGINTPITQYSHSLGFSAPNSTYNVGADFSLTPRIVSTTRYGYFFTNYHDFGWPTSGVNLAFQSSGLTSTGQPVRDNSGNPLPVALQLPAGTTTAPFDAQFTQVNASKHYQFDQDVAFFKGGWWGTHNIKVGYQFNELSNVINQHGNLPNALMYVGAGQTYSPGTAFGGTNCGTTTPPTGLVGEWGTCAGQYGFVRALDFATVLKTPSGQVVPATDHNHALFVQDAWTIGRGLTLNLGLRVEKETLPAPSGVGISNIRSINFSWADKIEPRLGAAWGSANGKMKIFGSYGVTNDVMKLLLALSSWGAQGYEFCTYPLGPDGTPSGFSLSDLNFVFNAAGRACPTGVANVGAVFGGTGAVPQALTDAKTGIQLIENENLRPEEPVVPNLKPYRQHEFVAGWDYQIGRDWAFEARYDRRRLDHVIEDASLSDPNAFEIYNVVNPGEGVNKTLNGYANYLTSIGDAYGPGTAAFNPKGAFWTGSGPGGTCLNCPNNPVAVRNYDGAELRLTKLPSRGFSGMFSYTYSRLWGNYTGLTTTDQSDGGTTGRDSPDTTRSFDEPFFYFNYKGQSTNGPLPTDRPNAFKGFANYTLPWGGGLRNNTTTFGLFQVAYSGSPMSSFMDLGQSNPDAASPFPWEATYLFGRGNWVNATANPTTGAITIGDPYARRTPWFTQTDFNLQHAIKVNKNNEHQVLSLNATLTNLLNQRAPVSFWEQFGTNYSATPMLPPGPCGTNGATAPCNIFSGAAFYQAAETGYNPQAVITSSKVILNSLYGSPNLWQLSRNIRLGAQFTW